MPRPQLRLPLLAVAAFLLAAPSAHAEYPLVGVLTGGELRSSGQATIRQDEVASDVVNDPATTENCNGDMCNDRKDLVHHARASVAWDTSWLVDARYPGMPVDPQASPNAIRWKGDLGTWSLHRTEEDFAFPDDQGEGGHDANPVRTQVDCETPLVARMPSGGESPLVAAGGAFEGFDAAQGRSFYLNAYGSTFNRTPCGENDRQGFLGLFGFVPVDGDAMTWDLGAEPKEGFTWQRAGRLDKTAECDPKWTDGTPRDTETQCSATSDVTADNRLSCALCVTDIRYDQHPAAGSGWEEVGRDGTWDGNEVRVTAVIENRVEKTLTVPVLLRDQASGRTLDGPGLENPRTVTFPPGSTTTIEGVWRTDGFAWEKGKPLSERNIQVLTPYGGAMQRIMVRPRPVVLVHGWNSDASAWSDYPGMLAAIHPGLRGFAVGDGQFAGTMNTSPFSGNDIRDNAAAEGRYIQRLRESLGADHVDIVAHSMGGLISRQYIHAFMPKAVDGRPAVRRLVMLGTPNQGSPCADLIRVAARGIPTEQLTTGFARGFNATVTDRKGVAFSIAAGDVNERTCSSEVHGDGVVEVPSARWTVGDRIVTFIFHTSMTADGSLLSTFVKPRIGLDQDAAKALAAAGGSALSARRELGAPRTGVTAAAARADGGTPTPGRARAVQSVGASDVTVSGTRSIRATFERGATPGFAFTAASSVVAELVDPKGRTVASQAAASPGAALPIRWLAAPAPRAGTWTLRLKGNGRAVVSAVATGGRAALTATARRTPKGALRIAARLRHAGRALRGAKITAQVTAPGAPKPITVRLRATGSKAATTVRRLPAGPLTVVVTARRGSARLVTAADIG